MRITILVMLLVFSALAAINSVALANRSDDDRESAAVERACQIFTNLYLTLRDVAFPKSPYSDSDTVHNRFILMTPGKVLNYDDYYPGNLYTASMKAKNTSDLQSLVPSSVMGKWFDIADVVVGGELNSGVTGKSMATIYRHILSQKTVKDLKHNYVDAEARYNEAKSFLTEVIQNPEDLTEETTRLKLYNLYREEHAKERLKMENAINDARQTKNSVEYELWFQYNFPLLNARVENAYTKWLIFGQKEQAEIYITYLDKPSGSEALKEARTTLRTSEILSMDHTRMIYPVSFEPGNWYEYLLPE